MVHLEGHSVVQYGEYIYIFGGKDHTTGLMHNNVYKAEASDVIHRPGPANFELVATSGINPSPRCYHSCTLRGQFMVVVGGLTDGTAGQTDAESSSTLEENLVLYSLNLDSFIWGRYFVPGVLHSQHSVPKPRCHATLTSSPDALLFYGGFPIDAKSIDDFENLPPASLQPDKNAPPGGLDASVDQDSAMSPANNNKEQVDKNHWHVFSIAGQAEVRPIPINGNSPMLWGHSAVFLHDSLILFGGIDMPSTSEVASLCVFSSNERRWRWAEFSLAPEPRALHSAVVSGSKMVVFGGFTGQAHLSEQPQFNDVWTFSLNTGIWEETMCAGDIPSARSGHAATVVEGKMLVFGGLEGNDVELSQNGTCAILDLASNIWTVKELAIPDLLAPYAAAAATPVRSATAVAAAARADGAAQSQSPSRSRGGAQGGLDSGNATPQPKSPTTAGLPFELDPSSRRGFIKPPKSPPPGVVSGAISPATGANLPPAFGAVPSAVGGVVPPAATSRNPSAFPPVPSAAGNPSSGPFGSSSPTFTGTGIFGVPPAGSSAASPTPTKTTSSSTLFDIGSLSIPPAPVGKKTNIGPDPFGVFKTVTQTEHDQNLQQMEADTQQRQQLLSKYLRSPSQENAQFQSPLQQQHALLSGSAALQQDEQLNDEWWTTPAPPAHPNPNPGKLQQMASTSAGKDFVSPLQQQNAASMANLSDTLSSMVPQSVRFQAAPGAGGSPLNFEQRQGSMAGHGGGGGYTSGEEALFSPDSHSPSASPTGGRHGGGSPQYYDKEDRLGFATSSMQSFEASGNAGGDGGGGLSRGKALSPFVAFEGGQYVESGIGGGSDATRRAFEERQARMSGATATISQAHQQPPEAQQQQYSAPPVPQQQHGNSLEAHQRAEAAYRKRMGLNPI